MSQPGDAPRPVQPAGRPARYQRSTGGLVGAMLVAVVAVLVFVGLQSLRAPDRPDAVRPVDWEAQVRAGRADGKLTVPAPPSLPSGWVATSAIYTTGTDPQWQLGLLTDQDRFVGVFERVDSTEDLVDELVDENAQSEGEIEIGGQTWEVFTDRGGDYAVVRRVEEPVGETGALLVVGSAPDDVVRDVAASLES